MNLAKVPHATRGLHEEHDRRIPAIGYPRLGTKLIKGDVRAFKVLAERAYGKVKENVELELTTEGVAERLQAARQRMVEGFSKSELTQQIEESKKELDLDEYPESKNHVLDSGKISSRISGSRSMPKIA